MQQGPALGSELWGTTKQCHLKRHDIDSEEIREEMRNGDEKYLETKD